MKAKVQHEIQEYCSLLKLNAIGEHFEEAISNATDYEGFLHQLLRMEVDAEEQRAKERKIKGAIEMCTRVNGKPMVINSQMDAMVFLIYGGQAIVREDICEKYLQEFLQDFIGPNPELKILKNKI